ncbi:MAG: hypothetical protein JRC89_08905 [Deltaproteobacteria bacterium]|nr:hypothetical protein [Deltaproteobacteria bacterium]
MTIRIPNPNLADMFLKFLGKKRAVHLPTNLGKFGPYYQATGIRESFWKALFRPKSKKLPEGTVDIFLVKDLRD